MATKTVYVDTEADTGGTGATQAHSGGSHAYNTLATALSMEAGDLTGTGTGGVAIIFECAGNTTADLSEAFVTGYTTTVNDQIVIRANRSADDTDGFNDTASGTISTSYYRIAKATSGDCVDVNEKWVTVDGLQLYLNHSTNNYNGIRERFGECHFVRNKIVAVGVVGNQIGIGNSNGAFFNDTNVYDSNVILGFGKGISVAPPNFADPKYQFYNNTVYGCTSGFVFDYGNTDNNSSTVSVINNVSAANTTDWDFTITGGNTVAITGSYNASDDGQQDTTATWTNDVVLTGARSTDFISAGTGLTSDLRPATSGSQLDGAGTAIGTDTDNDDVTTGTRADIGAWELVAAGGAALPPHLNLLGVGS